MDVDDMIGRKFGCLTVIRRIKANNGGSKLAMLDARCDCGTRLPVVARDLRAGATLKCDRCYLVPLQAKMCLTAEERQALASADEASRSEREQRRQQILARKRVAEAKRSALQEKADRRKEERIQRLRQRLAAVRWITGNNGDGDSQ